MPIKIQDYAVVLFQGDSITDHGRSRTDLTDLGSGYPLMTAGWFSALHPQKRVTFINRGVSGDRAQALLQRWDADCLALKPTWVSILVGINDTWRRYDSNDPTSTAAYEQGYRTLLERTRARLNPQIILCEPFLLPVTEDQKRWREDLDPKIEVVRKLSREFDTMLLPLDTIFTEAAKKREAAYWLADGVHTTPAGAALIARSWLQAVEAL